jgi:2-oxoisovalerate dehydrogenase E1 component
MIDLEKHKEIIEKALLIRFTEERILKLFSEGKINGTVHTCVGQELIGASISKYLDPDDFVVSNHRGHGHFLAKTGDVKGLISEIMGKVTGICSGIGGSQHLFTNNFLSNGIQGGMAPIAAGIAFANKYKNNRNIVVSFMGEGTLGEGIIYETFNICSNWDLPVLFVLENNGYSQSTSFNQTFKGSVEGRATGFGINYLKTNTWDLDNLVDTAKSGIDYVRENTKPCLLEIETYRLNAHSKGDDNRSFEELESYRKKDLLNQLIKTNTSQVEEMISKIMMTVDEAVIFSNNSRSLSTFSNITYETAPVKYSDVTKDGDQRISDIIYKSLRNKFLEDENYIMIGEDIEYLTPYTSEPYGGAFKVTRDLSLLFKDRIKNSPISEAAITGLGTGLAINGMRPIVEIMFGDFTTLIFDQIFNHACKFNLMSNGKVDVPLIIRTPMGGKRGYGPTHSQSIEKFFIGIPNLEIIALNQRASPEIYYNAIFLNNIPTLVIENKILYTRKLNYGTIKGFKIQQSNERYPTVRITPFEKSPIVTIVCYGGILEDVEKAIEMAFDEEEILCEIICPALIHPLNIAPISDSVKLTRKLLVVEEGINIAALSSEISSMILERGITLTHYKRMGNNTIVPCSYEAENNLLPNPVSIFNKIKEFL